MNEIIIVGSPNAGKTTLFNRLTRSSLATGNRSGVTVTESSKVLNGLKITDLPGLYSLNSLSYEEDVSRRYILSNKDGLFINVIDARYLKSSLNLTFELIKEGIYPVVVITRRRELLKRGGRLYADKLSSYLGLKVVFYEEFSLRDLNEKAYKSENMTLSDCYKAGDLSLNAFEKLLVKPVPSLIITLLLTAFAFYVCFSKNAFTEQAISLPFNALSGVINSKISSAIIKSFLNSCIIGGLKSALLFLPQITSFYFFLILLEESGISSFTAVQSDVFFKKLGLNGRALFSLLTGLSCTAVATLSARINTDRRSRIKSAALTQFIPCSARLPVILTLLSKISVNNFSAVCLLYVLSLIVAFSFALLSRGEEEDFFIIELPPVQAPDILRCLKNLLFQVKGFIIKISSVMLASVSFIWLLSTFDISLSVVELEESMIYSLSQSLKSLFYPMGIEDWRISVASLGGIIAKENIAGLLSLLYPYGIELSSRSAVAYCSFIILSPPCVSAFAVAKREIGLKNTLLLYFIQTLVAFLTAYLVYFSLGAGFKAVFICVVSLTAIFILKRICNERIYRKRKFKAKGIYR